MLVAIDGPAGSGKSSVARIVAKRLGMVHLDTGATYRAVAHQALNLNYNLKDVSSLIKVAGQVEITPEGVKIAGNEIYDEELRVPEVSAAASEVSVHPGVRQVLVQRQREAALKAGDAVMEGRDIGTVVLPDAQFKFFLFASPEERARRRALQSGTEEEMESVRRALLLRDKKDIERETSPLKPADGAIVIDTTDLSLEEVVVQILAVVERSR